MVWQVVRCRVGRYEGRVRYRYRAGMGPVGVPLWNRRPPPSRTRPS